MKKTNKRTQSAQVMTARLDPNWDYEDVKLMLYQLAWDYQRRYGITFEEALSEAHWGFVRAWRRYNAGKHASFSSWCYFVANKKLQGLIRDRARDPVLIMEINEELVGEAPAERSPCLEVVEGLSKEAQEIVKLLLETPAELLQEGTATPRQLLARVRDYMIARGKVTRKGFAQADAEIRAAFSEVWA